ncbi:hypothetical protein GYMLUDRAFT_44982 [Collybiopsis luxurians FD-317 M1]|uniref:DUF6534 domain-containing protein n=1 Tax=Collybiopsis luxurians FD-317 M1 TaxID=944289 RepID=A0A0D0BU34_9AGAR|nr:hypothetical protein GYMLUDRAFT_44982 [Collybiopsis luxurians FD-317 M1]
MENQQAVVQSIFGPIFIGVFLNAVLYGALVVQTYFYFQSSNKDPRWTKFFVLFLLIAETASLVIDFAIAWEPLIENYGSPEIFQKTPTTFSADPLVTSVISTAVQAFQGWRIRKLTKSNLIFAFIILTACASLTAGFTTTVLVALHPFFNQLQMLELGFLIWLAVSALVDILIAVSLSWFVLRQKKQLRQEELSTPTNSVLNRIMFFTLQTGAITALASIADVLTFTLSEDKTLQLVWAYSLSKLYSNSLLSMLNARAEWSKLLKPSSKEIDDPDTEIDDFQEIKPQSKGKVPATVVHPPF